MAPVDRLRKEKKKQISVALLKIAPKPPVDDMEEPEDEQVEDAPESVPPMPRTHGNGGTDSLCKALQALANEVFTFYMTAHKYHWNVVSENFSEYHEFFSDIYTDAHASVDDIAEKLRQLDDMATVEPGKTGNAMDLDEMLMDLYQMNDGIIESYKQACKLAEHADEPGIGNFLAGRVEAHQKHRWMLKASIDGDRD